MVFIYMFIFMFMLKLCFMCDSLSFRMFGPKWTGLGHKKRMVSLVECGV